MTHCRLCSGQTKRLWSHRVLEKYEIDYFECRRCRSLQTEEPYWLAEAYAEPGVGFDTGAAQRSLDNALTLSAALEIIGFDRQADCLDFGAGAGLFARLMRDRGWRYFAQEKFTFPYFMDQFQAAPADRRWRLISAFEVFEHLPNPAVDLAPLFPDSCDLVFFTTELWQRQGSDWLYLTPLQGQHVFCYSRRAMDLIGQRYGFAFVDLGFVKCFSRPTARERLLALNGVNFDRSVREALERHGQNPYRYANRDCDDLLAAYGRKD